MPLVQVAQGKRQWLKIALALTFGMVVVTGLFGAIVGLAGGAFAGVVSNRVLTAQVMKTVMVVLGVIMVAIGLGEFGIIRPILPEFHPAESAVGRHPGRAAGGTYRQAAIIGLSLAATFGIVCTRPTYLALVFYVAVIGSAAYGLLAMGAYGIGLAVPIALGGFALLPISRSTLFFDWIRARHDALHIAQGILFALLGAVIASYFWIRYLVPAT